MSDTHPTIYRSDYRPFPFVVESVELRFDIQESLCVVDARLCLRRSDPQDQSPLLLDGEDLDTQWLRLDGKELSDDCYQMQAGGLRIEGVASSCVFESRVHLRPQENTELSGLYMSGSTLCTQCEAEGFRRITWYPDRPDVLSRFRVQIRADSQRFPVLLSNGNRLSQETAADLVQVVEWEDPHPKPSYLFALVAGQLESLSGSFTTASGRRVTLDVWVEAGMRERAQHALASLQHAMRWDEQRYGREYDLDYYAIVAVSDFNMGAMENKGLNIFNAKYVLASQATATDSDFEHIEAVIAHEYFHNWTGNRITCRDWFQLTLKEGLTVFRDQQFSADRSSPAVQRIEQVRGLRAHQFPEDAGPMAHPIRPESYVAMDNFYTATVYNKGAEVIRMYHSILGEAGFRAGMDLYFSRHDGQAVTCDDFRAAMADANQRDFSQFERWYDQAGTPIVCAESSYDPASRSLRLRLRQEAPSLADHPPHAPYHIPIRLGLLDRRGQALPLFLSPKSEQAPQERVLELMEEEQEWVFYKLDGPPILSLLRDFSAPVRLRQSISREDLTLLAAHDPDPFNRWQAGQEIARTAILETVEAIQAAAPPVANDSLLQVHAALWQAEDLDGALKALALSLPDPQTLSLEFTEIPLQALHQAWRFHRRSCAEAAEATALATYQALSVDPHDASVLARQQRRLRHCCLAALAQLDDRYLPLLREHYWQAGNMSEMMAALALLAVFPEAEDCLDDFYQRFQTDALVIDKWFSVQALADRPDTVERVQGLLVHPDFHLTNPNRVRSLIGAFAQGNLWHFHAEDGLGYRLLGGCIRQLAQPNPQLAARLTTAFNHWRRYDPERRGLMRQELEAIRASQPSRDVMEILDRALS